MPPARPAGRIAGQAAPEALPEQRDHAHDLPRADRRHAPLPQPWRGPFGRCRAGYYNGYEAEFSASVIEEAGKFATDVLEPLNQVGDREGIKLTDKGVVTASGWPDAYKRWCDGGWNAVSGSEQFGGQGLPLAVHAAVNEIWSAANLAFGLCPLLTLSAIDALDAHGSDELKNIYLAKLISGEWPGTMQLTEPQAGTDVGALRTRAEKQADGSYRLFGTKIFITYGDHDMSDNIVHFILARLPGSPPGTKGITLFLAPKYLVNADGSLGARNDIYASGIEHKLGIHASPTCTMTMGDKGGAVAWLVGAENGGMQAMFTMMNQARLGVGLQASASRIAPISARWPMRRSASRARRSATRATAQIRSSCIPM